MLAKNQRPEPPSTPQPEYRSPSPLVDGLPKNFFPLTPDQATDLRGIGIEPDLIPAASTATPRQIVASYAPWVKWQQVWQDAPIPRVIITANKPELWREELALEITAAMAGGTTSTWDMLSSGFVDDPVLDVFDYIILRSRAIEGLEIVYKCYH